MAKNSFDLSGDVLNDWDKDLSERDSSIESENQLEVLEDIPNELLRRVLALKKLHQQKKRIDNQFIRQYFDLQKQYDSQYEPLFERRRQIVTGEYEPLDSDLPDGQSVKAVATEMVGIPDFWLKVLLQSPFEEHIQDFDEPILKHLNDIKVTTNADQRMYSFAFHFSPNDYFSNEVLTKDIYFPMDFEDMDVLNAVKCESTTIDWKEGKDVTCFAVEDCQTKAIVYTESFFRFFWSTTSDESLIETEQLHLRSEWAIAKDLFEVLIPNAVIIYTGEMTLYWNHNCDDLEVGFEDNYEQDLSQTFDQQIQV